MKIESREHYDILESFERNYKELRLNKEKDHGLWKKGQVYENGETNNLYRVYLNGYMCGRLAYMHNPDHYTPDGEIAAQNY